MVITKIDLTTVKGVLIDLDNTLFNHPKCHKIALTACYDYVTANLFKGLSRAAFDAAYQAGRNEVQDRLFPQGVCRSRLLYFKTMMDNLGATENFGESLVLEKKYIDHFLSAIVLDKTAGLFLNRCKESGILVCIVTNLNMQFQIQKIQKLEIEPCVSCLVTSEEVGVEKPNPLFFEIALKKLGLAKDDVIMIGDDEEKDIQGAKAMGIPAFRYEAA